MTLSLLFLPERADRLVEYHARNAAEPTLDEAIDAALQSAGTATATSLSAVISNAVKARIVEALFRLAADPDTSFAAAAQVSAKLHSIAQAQAADANGEEIRRRIAAFERDPEKFKAQPVVPAPPGSPIGDDESF